MTNATQQFIEDAIKGGWNNKMQNAGDWVASGMCHQTLLDPLVWQAVDKMRGWEQAHFEVCGGCGVRIKDTTPARKNGKHYSCKGDIQWWPTQASFEQCHFMNRLAVDNKSIEEALNTIN